MTSIELHNLIQHFNNENLVSFIEEKNQDFRPIEEEIGEFEVEGFENIQKLGEIEFSTSEALILCSIKVTKNLTERSGKKAQFDLAKKVLKYYDDAYDGIFVFHDDAGNFRFSLIYANYFGNRKSFSNYRRFTYLVSKDQTNKTFLSRMDTGDFSTLDGIKETFSVEKVTKEFYEQLSYWYFWACQEVQFPNSDDSGMIEKEISVIRLITRIIFIWFMREKNLIGKEFFEHKTINKWLKELSSNSSSYYLGILQNLFFATLNTPQGERRFRAEPRGQNGFNIDFGNKYIYRYQALFTNPDNMENYFKSIPFFNGGLFECLDKDGNYFDGFTDIKKFQPSVPNKLFFCDETEINLNNEFGTSNQIYKVYGLFETLSSYNFTIDENTLDDQEVALDPELLGRVFENLLANFNPETSSTARKSTGSFYTPRETVNYMVEEALVEYFKKYFQAEADKSSSNNFEIRIRKLLSSNETVHDFKEDEVNKLIKAIDSVKILDPACGSGAFPMGMLNKLVFLLHRLDEGNHKWKNRQIEKAKEIPDSTIRNQVITGIDMAFSENELDYGRKLFLIQNCIFGVDIQPIAVQISKLRFFISLLVDQKIDITKPNSGIMPLPNLESKIVAADTLIVLGKTKQLSFVNPAINEKETELASVRNTLFSAQSPSIKKNLREKDSFLRNEISTLLLSDDWNNADLELLASWDPYDYTKSAKFFDSKWMFNISNGFDIIIGNPPYLESRHPSFSDEKKDAYQTAATQRWQEGSKFITRGADLLVYFYEFGLHNINDQGSIVYITQNSWLDTEYGKKFQTFLLRYSTVNRIVDSDYRYFKYGEGPNINTVITLINKPCEPGVEERINFVRFHRSFDVLTASHRMLQANQNDDIGTNISYSYDDKILRDIKWGILLNATIDELSLIGILNNRGKRIDDDKLKNIKIGQGLNLRKTHLIEKDNLTPGSAYQKYLVPFYTSDDGAKYEIVSTKNFILDKQGMTTIDKKMFKNKGYELFDSSRTSKIPPVLILPRGIGNKHFCALNTVKGFSSSCVDIYDFGQTTSQEIILNLWLFLNSTIAWLLRELTGRKNLGGGMLKAEAVDLEGIPIYYEFGKKSQIEDIVKQISRRNVLPAIQEIDTEEHKAIDAIVFDYLDLTPDFQNRIINGFREKIIGREKRSIT